MFNKQTVWIERAVQFFGDKLFKRKTLYITANFH